MNTDFRKTFIFDRFNNVEKTSFWRNSRSWTSDSCIQSSSSEDWASDTRLQSYLRPVSPEFFKSHFESSMAQPNEELRRLIEDGSSRAWQSSRAFTMPINNWVRLMPLRNSWIQLWGSLRKIRDFAGTNWDPRIKYGGWRSSSPVSRRFWDNIWRANRWGPWLLASRSGNVAPRRQARELVHTVIRDNNVLSVTSDFPAHFWRRTR